MNSLKRSLLALQCPFAADFNEKNHTHCVKLVRWLEDRKVRELDIEERTLLDDGPGWNDNFNKYLKRLQCQDLGKDVTLLEKLAWLTAHAVSLEYEDAGLAGCPMESQASSGISSQIDSITSLLKLQRTEGESDHRKLPPCLA